MTRRRVALTAALVVAFLLGIGLGEALNDTVPATGTQTLVRTLRPLPLPPAARQTVTITVRNR